MTARAKIWRNTIEAGTKTLHECPDKYRDEVIRLIRQDIEDNKFTLEMLQKLVEEGKMSWDEYNEIVGEI